MGQRFVEGTKVQRRVARQLHEHSARTRHHPHAEGILARKSVPYRLEGTVGGHWGLFDAYGRRAKFAWGGAVSNHPHWPWQAAGGVGLAALVFATALAVRWRTAAAASAGWWLRLTAIAIVAGGLIGWTVANVPLESLTLGDWLRSLAWAAVALMSPVAAAAALASGASAPSFARVLGRPVQRPSDAVTLSLGILLIALAVLSVQAALGLVFDARYRDFPFAPLTAATIPLLLARKGKPAIKGKVLATWKRRLQAPAAETAVAVTLAASAVYIVCNESFANWQAVWFSGALLALAFTLLQAQDGPS